MQRVRVRVRVRERRVGEWRELQLDTWSAATLVLRNFQEREFHVAMKGGTALAILCLQVANSLISHLSLPSPPFILFSPFF